MRKTWALVVVTIACALTIVVGAQQKVAPKPLAGWVVILDPGHGGKDPGANGAFEGKEVYEAAYTYDVALRVKRMATAKGATVFMTITDGVRENNASAQEIFPFNHSARFALDKTAVVAGTTGLPKRLRYGNIINQKYPKSNVAWMSIHLDKLGTNTDIHGVRIITPVKLLNLRLAKALEKSFGDAHRLRADDPVVASGDKDHGLRRLFVLTGLNQTRQKVLIELGNFNNQSDLWRIRAFNVRDAWATAIVRALEIF